jgi:hypothetical protein
LSFHCVLTLGGSVGEFHVFPTASYDSLVYGDRVDLEDNLTVDGVRNRILPVLRGRAGAGVPADVELFVHLPGGLPFLGGMLHDYSEACGGRVRKHRIYAVLARSLCGAGTEVIREVRDVSAQNARLHLSPLFDSSQRDLVNIALLLWYFQHDGPNTEKMLLALGRVTCFAPLMTNLYRFLEREKITGLNGIPITAALHTVFMYLLPDGIHTEHVFDHALNVAAFI